ncbi:MAG: hypothetical protein M1812_003881 [Candelaria pacifica]|nr:MAG: hypothetical protein M1812_003881 [Candelaria pacifica]
MVALGETIAVVDRSGKVISTSKHLINVFKEAKDAYHERKAEIVAGRQADFEERRVRRALKAHTINPSSPPSATSKDVRRTKTAKSQRPESGSRRHSGHHRYSSGEERSQPSSPLRYSHDLEDDRPGLPRRHTFMPHDNVELARRVQPTRSFSTPGPDIIDMDLAYGEIPPPLPNDETELKGLLTKLNIVLDEAHCVQYSVTTMIDSLQKNPDALAAVALTLAEISKVVAKTSPGMVMAVKGAFPAIFALLASPQFLVAAGVGVGVTVVALGGYKIVKKIQARNTEDREREGTMDELQEIGPDVNRIEMWRKGIEYDGIESGATSVDGEFITPEAAALRLAVEKEKNRKERKREGKEGKKGRSKSVKVKEVREKKPRKESKLQLLFR